MVARIIAAGVKGPSLSGVTKTDSGAVGKCLRIPQCPPKLNSTMIINLL